jgi:hypothetical protein
MGGDRGGWYSWDWLDNNNEPSADRIVPQWQSLEEGHRLGRASVPGTHGPNWFTVVVLEPNRTLVLHSAYGMFSGRSFDSQCGPVPRAYVDGIWGFHPRPAPGGGPAWWSVPAAGTDPGRWRCRSGIVCGQGSYTSRNW